jgi:acetylornithine deacetylase/succinyl-diaminopimelate desuccinylase-like protein
MAATRSSDALDALRDFLAIPSVSVDPAHGADVGRAAAWVAERLAWANGRVVETAGHPVVLGEWLGRPGARTILVYGHYDVQPAGDEAEWKSSPFAATVRDGRVYGRGATDDKGPVVVALETARRLLERDGRLPLNVRFLIEGEEEIGSPSLPGFLDAHRAELEADLVVSADGAMWRPEESSVSIAAKGLVAFDLVVEGPASDLHSGRHGGAVQNPNHALARILATLHDDDGTVAVPGFHDGIEPLSGADRAALAAVPFDDESYRVSIGVPALHGEPGFSVLERLWARPTLEVNEVRGGGPFTVIPRAARAHLTSRLVPGQRPDAVAAALAAHVERVAPPGVTVRLETQPGAVPAYAIAADHPAVLAAVEALERVYPGSEPLLVRMGGTLPAAAVFEERLGLKTLLFSFSTADEGLHAPNEFFRLARLDEGVEAWTELWRLLA